jgi:hypothetical protein
MIPCEFEPELTLPFTVIVVLLPEFVIPWQLVSVPPVTSPVTVITALLALQDIAGQLGAVPPVTFPTIASGLAAVTSIPLMSKA